MSSLCRFNVNDSRDGRIVRCGKKLEPDDMPNRCRDHRNNLPAWAQHSLDNFFPGCTVTRWSPGDGVTRYRIESADGSRDVTPYYLGRTAFIDALRMLHAAQYESRIREHEATQRALLP